MKYFWSLILFKEEKFNSFQKENLRTVFQFLITKWMILQDHANRLVQDGNNSIANALELQQSCAKPLIYFIQWNLSVRTTSVMKFITCDLFSYVI